jgi:hypothetical protein
MGYFIRSTIINNCRSYPHSFPISEMLRAWKLKISSELDKMLHLKLKRKLLY